MEHSIEELKRQYNAAKSRREQAQSAEAQAKRRWREAVFEATGFKGCIAETTNWRAQTVRFLPTTMGRWDHRPELYGHILKKDGTPGERDITAAVEKCVNLGPYAPAPEGE